jgi:hypothetical protein
VPSRTRTLRAHPRVYADRVNPTLSIGIIVRWPRVLDVSLRFDRELLDRSSKFVLTAPKMLEKLLNN